MLRWLTGLEIKAGGKTNPAQPDDMVITCGTSRQTEVPREDDINREDVVITIKRRILCLRRRDSMFESTFSMTLTNIYSSIFPHCRLIFK